MASTQSTSVPADTTVLLVHGAWHNPALWHPVIDALGAQSPPLQCATLLLPTNDSSVGPEQQRRTTMLDDAEAIRRAIYKLLAAGRRVIVVAHSYGGIPTTQAITADMLVVSRGSTCAKGGVVGVVFLSALVGEVGESAGTVADRTERSYPVADFYQETGLSAAVKDYKAAYFALFHDIDFEESKQWADKLQPMSIGGFAAVGNNAGWSLPGIRVSYIFCTQDRAYLPADQERDIAKMEAAGKAVRKFTLESSHSPFLSMPGKVAEILVDVARI